MAWLIATVSTSASASSLVCGRVADRFGVQAALAGAGASVVINAIALFVARRETAI